jgi:hypothetical protein
MDSGTWLLLFTGLLLGSILVFYFSPSYVPRLNAMANGPFKLNTDMPLEVIGNEKAAYFTNTDAGAFSAFVYLNPINRTSTYSGSGVSSGSGTDNYSICTCTTLTNCTNCEHPQYKSVFNICNIAKLEVMVAPDASRQGRAMAQIVIKTHQATTAYFERFVLPAVDVQKWTYITVSREGRRIDVYYNDRIVLSTKTQYYFKTEPTATITSGSKGLEGQLILANVYNYRLSTKDVSEKYTEYADTRGQPYFSDTGNPMSLSDIGGILPLYGSTIFSSALSYLPTVNLCPSGGCFNAPLIRPANPMYSWSSDYA